MMKSCFPETGRMQYIILFILFSAGSGVLMMGSCTDNPAGTSIEDSIVVKPPDSLVVFYCVKIPDTSIHLDTVTRDGARISWRPIGLENEYMVCVYDTFDVANLIYSIKSVDTICLVSRYEIGRQYYLSVFAIAGKKYLDTARIVVNGTQLFLSDTANRTQPATKGTLTRTFQQGGSVVYSDTAAYSLTIQSPFFRSALCVFPKTYHPVFSVGFYRNPSPLNVKVTGVSDSAGMNVSVTWDSVNGLSMTGYRAYLRDYTGKELVYVDTDTKARSVLLNTKSMHTVYKINVASLSTLGPGTCDSTFAMDTSAAGDNSFKLPYAYFSTYTVPVKDAVDTALVGVQGGMFVMGRTWNTDADEASLAKPVHEVVIPSFYLSEHEITCSDYCVFLNSMDSALISYSRNVLMAGTMALADTSNATWYISDSAGTYYVDSLHRNYPVLSLYWHGAAAFCNWLSAVKGLDSCYNADWRCDFTKNGYRLPTEAEFEYAASGAFSGNKQRYPWGHDWIMMKAVAGSNEPLPVKSFTAYHGFHDLAGNAYEYCNDVGDEPSGLYLDSSSYYLACARQGVVIGPHGPEPKGGHGFVLRGGGFMSKPEECTSYYRTSTFADDVVDRGFRVARKQ